MTAKKIGRARGRKGVAIGAKRGRAAAKKTAATGALSGRRLTTAAFPASRRAPEKERRFTAADLAVVSDNPEWTDEEIADAKPFAEVFPGLAAKLKRSRGRPRLESPKVAVSLRLDAELLDRLRSGGKGWQSEVNAILRKAKGLG